MVSRKAGMGKTHVCVVSQCCAPGSQIFRGDFSHREVGAAALLTITSRGKEAVAEAAMSRRGGFG